MASRNSRIGVLVFALIFPTVITWVYFDALKEAPPIVQGGASFIGKVIQFSIPVVWVYFWRRRLLKWRGIRWEGAAVGFLFGLIVSATMLLLYLAVLKPHGYFHGPDEMIRKKIAGMGLTSVWKYAMLGVFYALAHSFLEEYYWRWFVFRQWHSLVGLWKAVAISSLGFMAHHILVLATFFGGASPLTWFFSISVAIGGAVWAWLYHRSRSLLAPWVGHCLVDAAIFAIGYDFARSVFK